MTEENKTLDGVPSQATQLGDIQTPPVEGNATPPEEKKKTTNVLSLKKDMDEFKEETRKTNTKILGALESIMNDDKKVEPITEKEEETEEEIVKLTKQQRDIFEHYFDPADDFTAWYDINLNIFTIQVPVKLSNVSEAHKALYKNDLRSKKVDPNNILGSMKHWCTLVAQNLKYEKRIKLK